MLFLGALANNFWSVCFLFHFVVKWIIMALSLSVRCCFKKKKKKKKDIALVVVSLHDDFLWLLNIKSVVQEKERSQRVPFLQEEGNNCKYLCPIFLWIDEIPLRMCLAKFTTHNSSKFQDVNKPKNCPIVGH